VIDRVAPSVATLVARRGIPHDDLERLAMTTTKIMTTVSLVSALCAAGVVVARHAGHSKTAAHAEVPVAMAAQEMAESAASARGVAATHPTQTTAYQDAVRYETKPVDPIEVEHAMAKAQADAQRSVDVARARELDAEVAARPVDAVLARRASDLVESVRHLGLPGMDHLAGDAAECGRGACRIRIPSELVEPLQTRFAGGVNALHLFAFDPKDDVGSAIVYVLPETKVSSAAEP
jgi:hypothetical protein